MEPQYRRRRRRLLRTVAGFLGLVSVLAAVLVTRTVTEPDDTAPAPQHRDAKPEQPLSELNTREEIELARRVMLELPADAARPHPLAPRSVGEAIELPDAGSVVGTWIPDRFPATPQGALAQLVALNETALRGGDPATYARAYRETAEPDAPPVDGGALAGLLRRFRAGADNPSGPTPSGLAVDYEVTHGLIKGTTSGGDYVVACTLGQLRFDYQGRTASLGVGDCQALRRTADEWRIASGVRAAYAPSAWPGSQESVQAGYRPLDRGRP